MLIFNALFIRASHGINNLKTYVLHTTSVCMSKLTLLEKVGFRKPLDWGVSIPTLIYIKQCRDWLLSHLLQSVSSAYPFLKLLWCPSLLPISFLSAHVPSFCLVCSKWDYFRRTLLYWFCLVSQKDWHIWLVSLVTFLVTPWVNSKDAYLALSSDLILEWYAACFFWAH